MIDRQQREAGEDRAARMLALVKLGDEILGEGALERHVGLEARARRRSTPAITAAGSARAVADDDQAGARGIVGEDERLDLVARGADAGILDHADDRRRDQVVSPSTTLTLIVLPTAAAGSR